jgi:hypothetical protein
MALFGSSRDISMFRNVNRELLHDVIQQEIAYYKISLETTRSNIYGESSQKIYQDPVLLKTLVTRADLQTTDSDFGPDINRSLSFAFLRDDLKDIELVPLSGDIILWNEGYYEIHAVNENQLVVGKSNEYFFTEYLNNFGSSLSIIVSAHLTRPEKLGIARQRL